MRQFFEKNRNHRIFQKRPIIKQFIKFGLVGIINTLIDFSIYFVLTRTSQFWRDNYLWANLIAFSVAVLNSFWWNKKWTFRNSEKNSRAQFTKFYVINFLGLAINESLLYLFVSQIGLHDLLSKLIVVIVVVFFSFTLSKIWVFRPEPNNLAK